MRVANKISFLQEIFFNEKEQKHGPKCVVPDQCLFSYTMVNVKFYCMLLLNTSGKTRNFCWLAFITRFGIKRIW